MELAQEIRSKLAERWFKIKYANCGPVFVTNDKAEQNAVDIFKNEWVGAFPPHMAVVAGATPLSDDPRLRWWNQQEAVKRKHVLELGPMEASHTWQLLSLGAESVTAIESNTRSFLKCLVAKEVLGMNKARFLCADVVEYLTQHDQRYDVCLASGVLYHMKEPLRLLELVCRRAKSLFLWTHYFDEQVISTNTRQRHRFAGPREITWKGFRAVAYHREYGAVTKTPRHLGGSATYSLWLKRDDIVAALKYYGMSDIIIHEDQPKHVNGPAITLFARTFK